jgi:hypothetical protein
MEQIYILGENIGFRETLELELKEFTLSLDPLVYFEDDEIIRIVSSGRLDKKEHIFNKMIMDNILHYFRYYVPKYLSVFGNSVLSSAKLYIGVNDLGEITGIPYIGEFDITRAILEQLEELVYVPSGNIKKLLLSIDINIIDLKIDVDEISDDEEVIIKDYLERKHKYMTEYNDIMEKRRLWKEKLDYYFTKVHDYATKREYRKLVSKYILDNDLENKYAEMRRLLDSDDYIDIGTNEMISIRKYDHDDIVYWITECKDYYVRTIKLERPAKPNYVNFSMNIHNIHMSLLSNLRYKFVKNNENVRYYMIEIIFPSNYPEEIFYKNTESSLWTMRRRGYVNGEPGCY